MRHSLILLPVLLLAPLAALRADEVRPCGKPQPLFKEQSFDIPANWLTPTLQTGKKFHLCVSYPTFRAVTQTKAGPKPFAEAFPCAGDAIVRTTFVNFRDLDDPAMFKELL